MKTVDHLKKFANGKFTERLAELNCFFQIRIQIWNSKRSKLITGSCLKLMELIVRSTVDQTRRTFSQIFLSKNYLRQMQLVNNFHRTNFKYSDLNLVPNKSIEHHWCNILTIDFGKPNSTFHLLFKKCPKLNLTPLLLIK